MGEEETGPEVRKTISRPSKPARYDGPLMAGNGHNTATSKSAALLTSYFEFFLVSIAIVSSLLR